MAPQPKISVVMATYNRAETLRETIRHLSEQQIDPDAYEVIIVDDGSVDNTRQVVEQAIPSVPFRLKYLHHPNHGPGYTQNRGIREAQAPIVLLMADDIFMTSCALQAHLDSHAKNPEDEVAVLGRVLQSPGLNQSVFLRTWDPLQFSDFPDRQELPYYMFWAYNISFKRDFMLRFGMFRDERGRGGPAAHEDAELGYRLHQRGLRILYNKGALGYHHHLETLEGTLQRSYQRGLNWHDFSERVPQPEIAVRYRVYNLFTLAAFRRALAGPKRRYLMGSDQSVAVLSLRYLFRLIIFNVVTVPYVWKPILNYAERNTLVAKCINSRFYRGIILYYFLKGCGDGKKTFGGTHQTK